MLSQSTVALTASLDLGPALVARLPYWARPADVRIESFTVSVTTSDKNIAKDLGIAALGIGSEGKGEGQDQKWDAVPGGGRTVMLKREGLAAGDISLSDLGKWRLSVAKGAGKACVIDELVVFWRYVFVPWPTAKKAAGV